MMFYKKNIWRRLYFSIMYAELGDINHCEEM